ncbi:MAG: cell division protein FtsZ [Prolixibacteraceae bacterium]|nr:cell division protein FtsZ [Prolixibacteraceae bacterium]
MTENLADFSFPENSNSEIKVVGVGGGGGNAVNHMFKEGIRDVDFVICNTDSQALDASPIPVKVQLGASLTEGRGAGNKPEVGEKAALENISDVEKALSENTKMVFITAGMGGGTGTGGAPVIAEACKKLGFLTVAIVTIPFRNEGRRRIKQAIDGIAQLEGHVDSLLVINNERIREMYGDFGISEAFAKADNVLGTAAKGIAEIITVPGYINVDFADVETVMRKSGIALMGTGIAAGENRSLTAVEKALNSPLLNNNDIRGAKNILLNITSGTQEVTMDEVGKITDFVQNKAGFDADIIWGNGKDDSLEDEISVTIIATGFSSSSIPEIIGTKSTEKRVHHLTPESEEKTGIKEQGENKRIKEPSLSSGQKTIEFDISEENRQKESESEFEAMYPGTSKERVGKVKKNGVVDYSDLSDEDVDELENIPAYKRRNLRMNDPKYSKKVSNYSINKNNNITDKNSYLHDQVD